MSGTSIFLTVLAAALLACLLRAIWEPSRLETTHIRLQAGKGCVKDTEFQQQGQPAGSCAYIRIVFFSDLHMDLLRVDPGRLLAEIRRLSPDLILFGGDLAARQDKLPAAIGLIRQICGIKGQAPLLAVPGNHDTDESLRALEAAGAVVLQNSSFVLSCRGTAWQVIGLEDNQRGEPDAAAAIRHIQPGSHPVAQGSGQAMAARAEQRLVLVHNPDTLITFPPGQAAHFCAGHFHGGQIWMPLRLEFHLLRKERLPRLGLYKGCVCWGDMIGYINRGLGCVLLPLRFFSLPELTLIRLMAPDQPPLPAEKNIGGSHRA